jgi:hypothetical protein
MEQWEMEVAQRMAKAQAADSTPLEEGLTIAAEMTRGQERQAQGRKLTGPVPQPPKSQADLPSRASAYPQFLQTGNRRSRFSM